MSVPVLSWLFIACRSALAGKAPTLQGQSRAGPASAREPPPVQQESAPFGPKPDRPSPKSQSFSRSYGSILPTSLTYIVLSTRGCSPWRPAAVMSTTRHENYSLPGIFKGRRERTGQNKKCFALPSQRTLSPGKPIPG